MFLIYFSVVLVVLIAFYSILGFTEIQDGRSKMAASWQSRRNHHLIWRHHFFRTLKQTSLDAEMLLKALTVALCQSF